MKNNLIFYSDLHISVERHREADLVLSEVGRLAKKYNATVINGGDTHPIRGIIQTSSHDLLTKHYEKWHDEGIEQIILIGNHDQEDREGETHPMRSFGKFKGWTVVDKPKVIEDWAFMPHLPKDKILSAIKQCSHATYAAVHWGIRGAKRNDFNVDTDGVPVEWLNAFKLVFSGHYHFRNAFENVQYIGSPFQHTQAEANQAKGVIIYDRQKKKRFFKEIEGTPKHYKVDYKIEEEGVTVTGYDDVKPIDYVTVSVEGDAERVQRVSHDDIAKYFKCAELKFDRNGRVKAHSRLNLDSTMVVNPSVLMQKYVDFVETDLDKKLLLKEGEALLDLRD